MNRVALALFRAVSIFGRWLIKRLVRHGPTKVMAFVELRIDTMQDRLGRARTRGRKRLLRARIAWRVDLLAWLQTNKRKHTKAILRQVDRAVDEADRRIPWDHKSDTGR